jgi:DNA-binding Xre family transcriptional regulator
MKRNVDYAWHLPELMARNGMHNTTDLVAPLAERGVMLSPSQVYRLVTQRPERVSLTLVAALCDIFDCQVTGLLTTTAGPAQKRSKAVSENVVPLHQSTRPRRARIVRDE